MPLRVKLEYPEGEFRKATIEEPVTNETLWRQVAAKVEGVLKDFRVTYVDSDGDFCLFDDEAVHSMREGGGSGAGGASPSRPMD